MKHSPQTSGTRIGSALIVLVAMAFVAGSALAQIAVTTRSYNLQRTNANTQETILTQSNVSASQFGKLFSLKVDDQVYSQVLYVPNLSIAGGTHNTIFVATVNNSVFAFDADT